MDNIYFRLVGRFEGATPCLSHHVVMSDRNGAASGTYEAGIGLLRATRGVHLAPIAFLPLVRIGNHTSSYSLGSNMPKESSLLVASRQTRELSSDLITCRTSYLSSRRSCIIRPFLALWFSRFAFLSVNSTSQRIAGRHSARLSLIPVNVSAPALNIDLYKRDFSDS